MQGIVGARMRPSPPEVSEEGFCQVHMGMCEDEDLPLHMAQRPVLHRGAKDANFAHYDDAVHQRGDFKHHNSLLARFGFPFSVSKFSYCQSCLLAHEFCVSPCSIWCGGSAAKLEEVVTQFTGSVAPDFANVHDVMVDVDPRKQQRDAVLAFLCFWKFQNSILSVLPRDIAVLLAKMIYSDSDPTVWHSYRNRRVRIELHLNNYAFRTAEILFFVITDENHEVLRWISQRRANQHVALLADGIGALHVDAFLATVKNKTNLKVYYRSIEDFNKQPSCEWFLNPVQELLERRQLRKSRPSCRIQ